MFVSGNGFRQFAQANGRSVAGGLFQQQRIILSAFLVRGLSRHSSATADISRLIPFSMLCQFSCS
jgi:hypothetical protein